MALFAHEADAIAYLDQQKQLAGYGSSVRVWFWNGTGQTITYLNKKAWEGDFYEPVEINVPPNNWFAFLHVHQPMLAQGCMGALLYRAPGADIFFGYTSPWSGLYRNGTYTEIRQTDGFPDMDAMGNQVSNSGGTYNASANGHGYNITMETNNDTSPYLRVVLSN
ncbi:hypothetical protein RSOLAG22IIIB_09414 [Rhizoctonia solani]|uniref:Uncharacterized protein n=1 Tax=Rhizoctonia solani TaxID=456999 RepID=A0A0K6FYM0_9AGAM|nr:hypothetical protein RSOLAG22IIIB_09414 [Rhizoctonia solani]